MKKTKFKYNRSSFKPLPVALDHMDIYLNVLNGKVEGTNRLRITPRESVKKVRLDAKDLTIHSVELLLDKGASPLKFDYKADQGALIVHLPNVFKKGRTFTLRTRTTCVPSDNLLEGIYKDTTPLGCPQQYMSQCQQWGFQRILPVLDDCTAKCTMTTTLEADAEYTHLISNGNISRTANPDGVPVLKPGDPRRKIITYENSIPMPPYLFIAAFGTWDVLEDSVTYPSGRTVKLEYLVPPGRLKGAWVPMQILKASVLWQSRTQEYEYDREVYRTICMEKSNFGGMENAGNTTIVTDAAMVDEFTGDARLKYAFLVIPHEFEHNQCGSDVTMETPFDMWLNEGFTVDVERQFASEQFDPDGIRLDQIDSMRAPVGGPLSVEDAGHLGNIVRQGFNDPDELVDGLTYVKSAEVIRMLRMLLGDETYRRGKNLYFSRHKGGNADTNDFFKCFEEVSGRDLSQFKREWLFTIGYPKVEATHRYDAATRTLHLYLRQQRTGPEKQPTGKGGGLFHIPLQVAAVDFSGKDIGGTARTLELTGKGKDRYHEGESSLEHIVMENIPEPAFLSLNRDCSFYGVFKDLSATPEQLRRQIRLDPNGFNRVEAMRRLTDAERIKLIHNISAEISNEWQEMFAHIIRDPSFRPALKSYLLSIDEQSLERKHLPAYRERYEARTKLLKAVSVRYQRDLMHAFQATNTYAPAIQPTDGYNERKLKAVLLRTMIEANTPEVQSVAEEHFRRAWNISDKVSALACINLSDHPARRELLEKAYSMWKDNVSAYSSYLSIIGGGRHDDVFDMLAEEERKSTFRNHHPTHLRALFLPMAGNNKMLWTDRGLQWATETAIRIAPINENTVNHLIAAFQFVKQLPQDLKPKVTEALRTMKKEIDPNACPSVSGRINAYLGE